VKRNPFEYMPLTEIAALSEPGKELFQSLFVFENYSIEDIYLDKTIGFEISDERVRVATNYPLTWIVIPGGITKLNILYNTAFLDDSTIEEYSKQYIRILEQLATNVEIPYSQFRISGREESLINAQAEVIKPYEMLKSSFAKNAKSFALQLEDRHWTYQSLEFQTDRVLQQMKSMEIKDCDGGRKKAVIVSGNIAVAAIGVLSAIKAGLQPVIPGRGLENKDGLFTKAGFILTDTSSVKRIPSRYWTKCVFIEENCTKQEIKEQWKDHDDYSIMLPSAKGEEIISGSSLFEDYEELAGQSVTIDSEVFDQNFIVLMLMKMLMKGSSLKVIKYLPNNENNFIFTSCEKILGSGNAINQTGRKVYLPLYDGQINYQEALRKNLLDKGAEINLFLSDIYTGKEIYCVCLNSNTVRKNCMVLVDKYNNGLGKECLGNICLLSDEISQLMPTYEVRNTGYIGRIRVDGTLQLSACESRVGNIVGTYLDFEVTEKLLKEMGLAEDVIFVNRRTITGKYKTVIYYVNKQKEKQAEAES
jgi:hypothetical protein